jgi:hypothetical protein
VRIRNVNDRSHSKQPNARINRARIQPHNGQVDDEKQANSRSG